MTRHGAAAGRFDRPDSETPQGVPQRAGSGEVDVIILSLNRSDDTMAAIASPLAQEGVRANVFVVDQGSQPDELARLKAFVADKPVKLHALPANLGVPGGRNLAARLGSAPYLVALDNDAVFDRPDTLARAVARMKADPQLGAAGFRILNFHTGADDWTSWGYPHQLQHLAQSEFPATQFVGAGHCLRRSAFEAAGGYDESLFFGYEEMDLAFRMLNLGYRVRYLPELAVRHKAAKAERHDWYTTRFYFMARNRIYLHAKYGEPRWRIVRSAAGFLARGLYNGVGFQTIRAIGDASRLYSSFRQRNEDLSLYRLKPEVRAYIREHNYETQIGFWRKVQENILRRFPKDT